MARIFGIDWIYSELSRLRDGGLAGAEAENGILSFGILDIHSRAIAGSAKVCWVVDFYPEFYLIPGVLPYVDSQLRLVNASQASLNDWLEDGCRNLVYSIWRTCYSDEWRDFFKKEPSEASIPSYAVVVSAVVLLSLVYQYLTGNVDTGSSKAYSRSSLDFRDIYVAVVLFLGAYVWIKFREVALRGTHKRTRVDKRGRTKVVYDARLTPPKWNGETLPKLDLGQFATEQEAHKKFHIAAFYYNRDAGLLDGWFRVPPMSEEGRSLTGLDLRAWVIDQAKEVYEDFKKKAAALLLQELFEAWENEETPEQDEVNVDFFIASLLNPDEHQQPALVSPVENLEMDMAMPDDQGLECASQSFGGMHEGPALSNDHSLGFEEGSALPVSQLPPNTESGMILNGSDQWNLLQTFTSEASLLNSAEHQLPLLVSPAENSGMATAMLDDQGLECASQSFGRMHEGFVTSTGHSLGFQKDSAMPISQLTPDTLSGMGINNSNQLNLLQIVHNQQELITYLRQQLQESRIHISQLESQHFVQQQLQVVNQGVPSFEVESMPHQNHPCRPHGSALW